MSTRPMLPLVSSVCFSHSVVGWMLATPCHTVPGKKYHRVVEETHVRAAGNEQASLFRLGQQVGPAVGWRIARGVLHLVVLLGNETGPERTPVASNVHGVVAATVLAARGTRVCAAHMVRASLGSPVWGAHDTYFVVVVACISHAGSQCVGNTSEHVSKLCSAGPWQIEAPRGAGVPRVECRAAWPAIIRELKARGSMAMLRELVCG